MPGSSRKKFARASFSRQIPKLQAYNRRHEQEMEPDVIRRHIETFVNVFSMDAGEEGRER